VVAAVLTAAAIGAAHNNAGSCGSIREPHASLAIMSTNVTSFPHNTGVNNGRRVIERLKGTGLVTTERGKESSVRYHLSLTQDEVDSGTGDQPHFGPKNFAGQIWCPHDGSFVAIHLGQIMTLRMEDGRRLRFTHRNRDGGITVTQWIG
jgi:hypothetical protein